MKIIKLNRKINITDVSCYQDFGLQGSMPISQVYLHAIMLFNISEKGFIRIYED